VVETLAAALRKAMANQAVRERFRAMGVEVMDLSRTEFVAYVRADYEKWLKLARDANIVIE
jgi:tripartite-type tricarboxylate transporter receptor subunit TctC